MSGPTRLFRATRTLIKALWILGIVMAPVAAAVVLVMVFRPEAVTFSGPLLAVDRDAAELRVLVASVLVFAAVLSFVPLMRALLRIIDSAMTGDPFVPDNVRRLRLIGSLLLATNMLVAETVHVVVRGGILFPPISIGSLVTVLLVFVLAHVFEQGSRMRAELQETV